jgi:hypothetical protein
MVLVKWVGDSWAIKMILNEGEGVYGWKDDLYNYEYSSEVKVTLVQLFQDCAELL